MKGEKILGEFELGLRRVKLIATQESGGSLTCLPKAGSAEIRVGIKTENWHECFSILLHEAIEFVCIEMGFRFYPNLDMSRDSNRLYFFFQHSDFSEIIARAGEFVASASKPLKKFWRKENDKSNQS